MENKIILKAIKTGTYQKVKEIQKTMLLILDGNSKKKLRT